MAAESIILKAPGASGAEIELAGLAGFDATATDFSGSGQYVSTTYATRRNLCATPSMELGTGSWGPGNTYWVLAGAAISEELSLGIFDGTKSLKIATNGIQYEGASIAFNVVSGVQYTVSGYIVGGVGSRWQIGAGDGTVGITTDPAVVMTGSQQRISATFTALASGATTLAFRLMVAGGSNNAYVDGVMVEAASSAGTYFPTTAQLASGEAGWTGTANASASDIGCFANGTSRTFMGWASRDTTAGYHCLFSTSGASPVQLWITTGNQDVSFAADGTSFNTWTNVWPGLDQWVHWALAFDDVANTVSLYLNGLLIGTQPSTVAPNAAAGNLRWGARGVTPDIPFNGKLAWVSVHERILTATEIARCANPADYATAVKALSNLGQLLPLTATGGVTDQSTNARNGTAVGSPTVGGYSPGPVSNWTTESFDLGNPPESDEYIESDSDGAVPRRKPIKGNRTISHTIRVGSAVAPVTFKEMIGQLDQFFEKAKATAAAGVLDPINYYRIVYTPKDSVHSFFMPIFGGAVTDVPREMVGDKAGWFSGIPQITYEATCDPAGYGPQATYLDTTTVAATSVSVTVPGGSGDTAPWLKTSFKDVAAVARGALIAGLKQNEAATTATILASAMTPAAATYSAPNLVSSATDPAWLVMGTTARQTRTGRFRVYANRIVSATGTGSVALRWGEANSGVRPRVPVACGSGLKRLFLGEVNASVAWDMWLEASLDVSVYSLDLVPVDSYIETSTAAAGEQMTGAAVAVDALQSTSTHISGRALTLGGSWSTVNAASPTWPVSAANWARRSGNGGHALAIAGTANYMDHQVKATIKLSDYDGTAGVFLRCDGTASNFLYAYTEQFASGQQIRPVVKAMVAGVTVPISFSTTGLPFDISMYGNYLTIALQATSDGRWYCSMTMTTPAGAVVGKSSQSGTSALLVSGSTLGNAANAKAGLWSYHNAVSATTRDYKDFSVAPLLGLTPPPIASGATTTLWGAVLANSDGAQQPYIGSSGLELQPGVNNNLTVIAERSANGHASTSLADTPALDLDIVGYPRFLSVPH